MDISSKFPNMTTNHIWNSASDISGIEDGLLTPDNQQVFLTASMAFLQRKLQGKIEEKGDNGTSDQSNQKNYSNLLIIELNRGKRTERFYVRVKNEDKYEQIFKKESSVSPNAKLRFDQLLPKPKKPKTQCKGLVRFFKRNSSDVNLIHEPVLKRSASVFTVFKRATPNPSQSCISCVSCSSVQMGNLFENFRLPPTPSQCSTVSGFIKPQNQEQCNKIRKSPHKSNTTQKTLLGAEELEILRLIPSSPGRQDDLLDSDSSFSSNCNYSVRKRSSKLSVCMESEEESDNESVFDVSNYGSCNLTDEVKSNFSTEALDVIMRRLMQYFEYSPLCSETQRNPLSFRAN